MCVADRGPRREIRSLEFDLADLDSGSGAVALLNEIAVPDSQYQDVGKTALFVEVDLRNRQIFQPAHELVSLKPVYRACQPAHLIERLGVHSVIGSISQCHLQYRLLLLLVASFLLVAIELPAALFADRVFRWKTGQVDACDRQGARPG